MYDVSIHTGDVRTVLPTLPSESVHTIVTSVPYWQLRDYNHEDQIGLEAKPDCLGWARTADDRCGVCYICIMTNVFEELRRILRPEGTCWLNIGDKWASDKKWGGASTWRSMRPGHGANFPRKRTNTGLKCKDLLMVPHRLALSLQQAGWWVRQDLVWAKPNCLPESVDDRPSRIHEYVFLLTKSELYFYDGLAIREPLAMRAASTWGSVRQAPPAELAEQRELIKGVALAKRIPVRMPKLGEDGKPIGANSRSVWWIASEPYAGKHYAVMPKALAEPCILAGSSAHGACPECGAPWRRLVRKHAVQGDISPTPKYAEGDPRARGKLNGRTRAARAAGGEHDNPFQAPETIGWAPTCECGRPDVVPCTVLDPFCGPGTTLLVAGRKGRRAIGVEVNPDTVAQAWDRLREDSPLAIPAAR